VDDEFNVKEDFASDMNTFFDSGIYPVDFQSNAEQARTLINVWATNATEGKITELFSSPIDPQTKLVLLNAVYFKGEWEKSFDKTKTFEDKFFLEDGATTVNASYMQMEDSFNYGIGEEVSILELPYNAGQVSMLIILPGNSQKSFNNLQNNLSPELLDTYLKSLSFKKVNVQIPKFILNWGAKSLKESLSTLGLSEVFGDNADFSGISETAKLNITDVTHKAYVEVNEEGTEAAAATGATIAATSMPLQNPPVFKADHPFLFLILEKPNNSIIFIGRVSDPSIG
jgi:serpin B